MQGNSVEGEGRQLGGDNSEDAWGVRACMHADLGNISPQGLEAGKLGSWRKVLTLTLQVLLQQSQWPWPQLLSSFCRCKWE